MHHTLLILFTMLSILPMSSSAAVLNVPGDYSSIQAAINAAADGDTVLVADGTYTGTGNRALELWGKAITVASANGPDNCIIDCEDGYNFHRGFHCHSGETSSTVISGFTIMNATEGYGSGILCDGASPIISNCAFRNCVNDPTYSYEDGGTLYFKDSEATVIDCVIEGSLTESASGGGIFATNSSLVFTNCTITGNTAKFSGGAAFIESDITMTECSVTNNTAEFTAGGISFEASTALIANCEVNGNTVLEDIYVTAEGDGGGISITGSQVEIRGCTISGNTVPDAGGGIYLDSRREVLITGCIIQNNVALYGGGIYCHFSTLPVIGGSMESSNTFISNFAPVGADLYARGNGNIIDATYNSFDGYHLSDVCVSPQERFDLTGCTSISPVEQDLYVSPLGDDGNDGLSPLTPLRTIFRAMRMVSANGSNPLTVHLQPGIYSFSATEEHFPVPMAGFVTISGDGPDSVTVDAEGGYCVFYGSGNSASGISGVTLTGGRTSGLQVKDSSVIVNSSKIRENSGSGISAMDADLIVQFSLIEQNASSSPGGAISFEGSARHLTIRESIIRNNTSSENGGGVFCSDFEDGSVSISGSGILNNFRDGVFINDLFMMNSAVTITDCIIQGNDRYGLSLSGGCDVSGCDISWNTGDGIRISGSGVSTLKNCVIADNYGEGIVFSVKYSPVDFSVTNCSVIRNSAFGISIYLKTISDMARIANTIVWANREGSFVVNNRDNGILDVTHCCVHGGYPGDGSFSFDPKFMANQDFHLRGSSPCVDAGTAMNLPETDMDGNARIQGGGVDIGAYEFSGWPEVPRTQLAMSNRNPGPGDPVSCTVDVWNPGPGLLTGYPLFVILELFGELYFAPGFSNYDFYAQTYPEGLTTVTVLPDLTWPAGAGTYWGVTWYATLTNPQITALHGNMDTLMFGWHE